MGTLGLMNSISIYQGWISNHQLATHSSSQIAWTVGLYWNPRPFLSLRDPSWTDLRRQGAPVVNVAQLAARPANIRGDAGLHRLLAFPSHQRHHGRKGDRVYLPRACGEYWGLSSVDGVVRRRGLRCPVGVSDAWFFRSRWRI